MQTFSKAGMAAMCSLTLLACGGGGAGSAPAASAPPASTTPAPAPVPAPAPSPSPVPTPSPGYDVDTLGVPKFVDVSYIDLSKVTRLSRFRSGAGHDYADGVETCRSMKHYFAFPDETTAIYSPVAGTIVKIGQEWAGKQVRINADIQPAFTFVIFHVALNDTLQAGSRVIAGQQIGTHISQQTSSDIAVEVGNGATRRLVSYFDTLTDAAFAPYVTRGIASRDALLISRAARDAAPLSCDGEAFNPGDTLPQWVDF